MTSPRPVANSLDSTDWPAFRAQAHAALDACIDHLASVAEGPVWRPVRDVVKQGVLVPTGTNCEDAWVIASLLAAVTSRLKFIVAVRPGLVAPSTAARMAATFNRMSGGRLIVNVVGGGDPVELAGDGMFLDHDQRYDLMDEFLRIWRPLVAGEEVSFSGNHLRIEKGNVLFPCLQDPHPPILMGGSSSAAKLLAVEHADTLLTWAEPPADVEAKLASVRASAAEKGRHIKFGIRMHLIVRETEAQAWAAADDLIRYLDADTIARSQEVLARTQSEGQRRMIALHAAGRARNLEVSPNLWAGVGLVTGGAGTALVGSPKMVAERLREYADLGIDTFILSGYPHLEEAFRVAETLLPLLPIAGEAQPAPKPALRARVIPGGW